MMARIAFSTEKAWLDYVPLSHISFSTIFSEQVTLVSGDGFSVPIPASFLLASSKLLREIYLPNVTGQDIFLPSVTGESLLLVVELLRSGTTGVINGVENTGQKFKEVQGVMDLLQTGINVALNTANPRPVRNVEYVKQADSSLTITQVCSKVGDDQEENSSILKKLAGVKPVNNTIQYPKVNLQRLSASILGMDQDVKIEEIHCNNNSEHSLSPSHFPCQLCPKIFAKKSSLRKHIRTIHSETTHPWPCPDCDLRFIHQRNMKKHRKVVHNGVRYQCTQCDCNFRSKYTLNCHIKRKHEVKTKLSSPASPPPAYSLDHQCLKCDKSFGSRTNMMRHYNVIHEGMRFTCEDCGFMSGVRLRVVKHCLRSQHDAGKIKMVHLLLD